MNIRKNSSAMGTAGCVLGNLGAAGFTEKTGFSSHHVSPWEIKEETTLSRISDSANRREALSVASESKGVLFRSSKRRYRWHPPREGRFLTFPIGDHKGQQGIPGVTKLQQSVGKGKGTRNRYTFGKRLHYPQGNQGGLQGEGFGVQKNAL